MKKLRLLPIFLLFYFHCHAQADSYSNVKLNNYQKKDTVWQLLSRMTIDEKIGQLIMAPVFSINDSGSLINIDSLIRLYHIGGIIFFKGSPYNEVLLTNYGQSISKIPLFIAMDAEWGIGMRLDSVILFPKQMTLGAINNDSLIYQMGREIARQCNLMGININFAPVVDINNNPYNPVIHMRSFGEDKKMVTRKALMYMKGLRDGGIMAVAKHFPGHGDTETDSHKDLPQLTFSRERIDSLELYPFRKFIENNIPGIMVAHLNIPSLDTTSNLPGSLSPKIIRDFLVDSLCFEGLVFTDALNMQGVMKHYKPGEIEVRALLAGNDILVYPNDVRIACETIRQAVDSGIVPMELIDYKVERILRQKFNYYHDSIKPVPLNNLTAKINTGQARLLKRQLIENSLTLVRNKDHLIPFKKLDRDSFAALALGVVYEPYFIKSLKLYSRVDGYYRPMNGTKKEFDSLLVKLKRYSIIIVSLHNLFNNNTINFGISKQTISFIDELRKTSKVVLVNFGTPYALKFFSQCHYILQAYEVHLDFQELAAQALFGGIPIMGTLPVSVNSAFCYREGNYQPDVIRLKYTLPEELNIPSDSLYEIDSIAERAIRQQATPGCQVMAVKDGKVFYQKSFGKQEYDSGAVVADSDLYDLASVTKITATLPLVMKLVETGKLNLTDTLGKFIPEASLCGKGDITIRELLLHETGLVPWKPFYFSTMDKHHQLLPGYYSDTFTSSYTLKVADSMYVINNIMEEIWKQILTSPLKNRGRYLYSDFSFIILKKIAGSFYQEPFEQVVRKDFYSRLGMNYTCYNPWKYFPLSQVVPTELDTYWRKQLVHGYVHDMAAALMGGVSGHAGLFSNSNDLAKLMQMYLNGGVYGGDTFFTKQTVEEFTARQSKTSRRGYGFDKQETNPAKASPTCKSASPSTYGHTGFTGTSVWVDPEKKFIFIFLSNRVYPSADNNKLIKMNIRTDIQEEFYRFLK